MNDQSLARHQRPKVIYRINYNYIETIALAAFGCILILSGLFSFHRDLLTAIYPRNIWTEKSIALRYLMILYGASFGFLALASFSRIRYHAVTLSASIVRWIRSLIEELYAIWKWFATKAFPNSAILSLALIMLLGLSLRCFFLTQSMRGDESYTFMNFVNQELWYLFYYPVPNNHILHSLLARVSVTFFGSDPMVIRLPAFLGGLAVIPLTFGFSRLLAGNDESGYFSSMLVSLFPYLVLYDTMARGYSLLIGLSLCFAIVGLRFVDQPSKRTCALMSVVIGLGLLDMPTFLFPAAGIFLWILMMLVRRQYNALWILRQVVLPVTLMTAAFTVFLYTPAIFANNGIESFFNSRFTISLPWSEFLNRLSEHVSETVLVFSRDIPFFVLLGALILSIVGSCRLFKEARLDALMLFPALVIGGLVVLFAKHAIPYARTWIYILPFLFILVGVGFTAIIKLNHVTCRVAFFLLTSYWAVSIMSRGLIASYPDTGYFPEAPVLAEVLSREFSPGDEVVMRPPAQSEMQFYMWQKGIKRQATPADQGRIHHTFFIVKPSCYSITDMTSQNAKKLFEFGDAAIYVAPGIINNSFSWTERPNRAIASCA